MIKVDISNVWGQLSLPDLLAIEKEVFAAHQTLTEGSGAGNDFLGWLDLPVEQETEEIRRIRAAAERIRETSDVFVVIGIGGSYLGPRAAIELMQGTNHNLYQTLSQKFSLQIIASGGVSSIADIKLLAAQNLHGAIIGKAYYSGSLDLAQAIEVAK